MEIVTMTIKEAAQHADVSEVSVRRWVWDGKVKATQNKRTRAWSVDQESLDWFLENGPPDTLYQNR